jgi:Tol biopolymer transport system component
MTTRVLVLFVCATGVFGACGSSANSARNDASVGPTVDRAHAVGQPVDVGADVGVAPRPGAIAVVGDMRPNLLPRVFTFDAVTGARSDLAHSDGGSDPAVSPDRTLVAFAGKAGAYPALFVVPAAGGDAVQVTTPIPCAGAFAHPTWSPDGREIAFEVFFGILCPLRLQAPAYTTAEPHQLAVVEADGTGQRLLGVDGYEPRWSPDGTHLAYVERTKHGFPLAAVPGTTAAVLRLEPGPAQSLGAGTQPVWSPDGHALALPTGRGTVHVFTADGDLVRSIRGKGAGWTRCGLVVSRFGAVAASAEGRAAALRVARGVETRTCGGATRLVVHGSYDPVAFAPDGSRVLVRRRSLVVAGGARLAPLVGSRDATGAVWSPDSRRVAFKLPLGRVAVADVPARHTTIIADDGPQTFDTPPAWLTPTAVVYGDRATGLQTNLYIVNPELGGTAVQISRGAQSPAWAPGGQALAWAHPPGIWIAQEPREEEQLLHKNVVTGLAWSPTGRLAFSDGDGISIVNGRGSTRVVSLGAEAQVALDAWSPDGQWLAYSAYFNGDLNYGVWVIHPDGTERHLIVNGARKLAWSPDGRQTVYEEDGRLWVADPLGAHPARTRAQTALHLASWTPFGILAIRPTAAWYTQLVLIAPDGSSETPLTDGLSYIADAA